MDQRITKAVLFDYFAGHASALQKRRIDEWAAQPEAEEQFYRWLDEWERTHAQYPADVTPYLTAFHAFVQRRESDRTNFAPVQTPRRRTRWPSWLPAVAASLVLLLGLAWVLEWPRGLWYQTFQTTYNQTRSLELPDGSRATLNANSTLRYPRYGFGTQSRRVWLDGEADFSVVHTATDQPFVVSTARDLDVVVLGTEFTVFSRPRVSKVVLRRGRVRLNYDVNDERRQLTLRPGDVMTLSPDGRARLRTTRQPADHAAWTNRRVVFEETSLADVASLFRENYGLHLEIPDAATAQLTLSGSFTASDADELLRTVTDALGLGYRREGSTVYLTP